MIKIQTRQTGIPIEIGELQFTFDTSDESIKNFHTAGETIVKEIENMKNINYDDAKKVLEKGFDLTLGEGAFEQIYEQTPSLIEVVKQFTELSNAIAAQLKNYGISGATQQEKAMQYISKKQKNKKNKK